MHYKRRHRNQVTATAPTLPAPAAPQVVKNDNLGTTGDTLLCVAMDENIYNQSAVEYGAFITVVGVLWHLT